MKRRSYPSDITDLEWKIIEPLLPKPKRQGRKRETDIREVVNAIRYLIDEGCQWRALPHDFPHWSTVRTYFDQWKRKKVWYQLNNVFREKLTIQEEENYQQNERNIDYHPKKLKKSTSK